MGTLRVQKWQPTFIYETGNLLKGLFLLGTSHPRDIDLSNSEIPTLKVYAEHDGLASVQEVMENKAMLPRNYSLEIIQGNHSQFGYLGRLLMEDKPTISLQQQQTEVLTHLLAFLNKVDSQK